MNSISIEAPAKSSTTFAAPLWAWRLALALLALLVLGLAVLVASGELVQQGTDLSYNLGLAGGLMMLSLLLYPLRKRIRFLAGLGRMESWFRYHMFMGIGGPLLILFHSTFKAGSMNGRIALYAMLLVALSGVVGRFVYRHIHRGLYGRQLTLADAEAELKSSQENIASVFALQPEIEQRLKAFHERAFAQLDNPLRRLWRFMVLRHQGNRLARSIRHEARKALAAEGRQQKWPYAQILLNYTMARRQIDNYVNAIIQSAQLAGWAKLFSLWHVAHVPFIYLLVFSGIVHVVAVHLY